MGLHLWVVEYKLLCVAKSKQPWPKAGPFRFVVVNSQPITATSKAYLQMSASIASCFPCFVCANTRYVCKDQFQNP